MLWLKAFHIIFVVCWFAGLFYLPRIFVYYAASEHLVVRAQLAVMARKLYRFVTPYDYRHCPGTGHDCSKHRLLPAVKVDAGQTGCGSCAGGVSLDLWPLCPCH